MTTTIMTATKDITGWIPVFIRHLPLAGLCVAIAGVLYLLAVAAFRVWEWRNILRQHKLFLEVTPPISADKTPLETQEFFNVIHGIGMSRTTQEMMQNQKFVASFEMPSTKEHGIRYVVGFPAVAETWVRQALSAHVNNARIRLIDDYLPKNMGYRQLRILEFKQRKAYYLPLKIRDSFLDHDSMAYLTNIMTELSKDEHVTLQVIVSPGNFRDANIVDQRVRRNENMIARSHNSSLPTPFKLLLRIIFKILSEALHFVVDVATSSTTTEYARVDTHTQQARADLKPMRAITPHEQEVNESIRTKVNQKLFRVEIRALVVADDKEKLKQHTKAIRGTLAAFDTQHQGLRARYNFPTFIKSRYRLYTFEHRLPSLLRHNSCILSAEEIANLYHFPAPGTSTESLVQSLSRTLPAPLSLKRGDNIDVVLGVNRHGGHDTPIGLSKAERARHTYVIGATGHGKSTMMEYAIMQDIMNGNGVAVLDPHGDMARDLLQYIPEERMDDVIYFDPDDLEYPIRLNPLELNADLTGDDLEREKYLLTEYTVEIFRKLFSDDDSGGSRIEAVLRNAIYIAFTTKDPTLFTIYRLITDKDYRRKIANKLDDEVLKNFWNNEFDAGGEYQRVKMGFGVTTKINRFLTAIFVRRVMDTPKSTIDFDRIINEGKILICKLSKGDLVKDTSSLFGTTVLARLQIAGQRRGKMREKDRRPFYIYIDEFQNFATTTFVEMLAESRKYGLHLFMAEQSTYQQDKEVTYNILNNANNLICFSMGNPMDERLVLPRFQPPLTEGEIQNLPSYNFYARIKPVGTNDSQLPVSGMTIMLDSEYSKEKEDRVIAASRTNYAKKYEPETHGETAGDDGTEKSITITITNPTEEPA